MCFNSSPSPARFRAAGLRRSLPICCVSFALCKFTLSMYCLLHCIQSRVGGLCWRYAQLLCGRCPASKRHRQQLFSLTCELGVVEAAAEQLCRGGLLCIGISTAQVETRNISIHLHRTRKTLRYLKLALHLLHRVNRRRSLSVWKNSPGAACMR